MEKHDVGIASPPDRERLVAEILFERIQWAEINVESGTPTLEIYPRPDGQPWRFELEGALAALTEAASRLPQGESKQ